MGLTGHSPSKLSRQIMSKASAFSNAYIDKDLTVQSRSEGALSGLTFAVKDMYNVSCFLFPAFVSLPACNDMEKT